MPRIVLQYALVLWVSVFTLCAQDENPGDPPPSSKEKNERKTAPQPLKIEKPKRPYTVPQGPSKVGWELLLKNDLVGAEQLFRQELQQAPNDLETLEGLRSCLVERGLYTEAQKVQLTMLAASFESPLCILFVTRVLELFAYADVREDFIETLKTTAAKAQPQVRAALQDALATMYYADDKPVLARETLNGLGYIERWSFAAGPFGKFDRNNPMDRRFAPERALKDLEFKDEQGKPVKTLRDLACSKRSLELSRLFSEERGLFYALTNLECAAEQDVLLLVGGPHETRLFLNGVPVFQPSGARPFERGNPILKTRLRKGANTLLVKLPFPTNLVLRVLSTDYAPATGISYKPLEAQRLSEHEVVPVRGFLYAQEVLGQTADYFVQKLPVAERSQGLLGVACAGLLSVAEVPWFDMAAQHENDQPAREAAARCLVGSFPDSVGPLDLGAVILSSVGRSAGHTESRHTEEARQLRERALSLVPDSHQHLLGLYRFLADRELKDQAYDLLKKCTAAHPRSGAAQERTAQAYLERNMPVQAEMHFEAAAKIDRAFLPPLLRFHETHGNKVRAQDLRKQLAASGREEPLVRFQRLLATGQFDAAQLILEEQEKLYPERKERLARMRAGLLEERGDVEAAYALRKKMLEDSPRARALRKDVVDAALRLGKTDEARENLRSGLQERPGDFESRRRLQELEGKASLAWWEPYDVNVNSIDTSKFTQDHYPRSNHAWIVDFMVTKIHPDLSRESYVHIAQKVLNNNGIQELSEAVVRAQSQNIVFIRTLNPDGSTYHPQNIHNFDLAQSASFYKVGPGSILEHAYLTHEDAPERNPRLDAAFNFMALDAPRAISRWIVMVPKTAKLKIRKICPELIEERILPGPEDYTVYQWTNKHVEGIKVELHMPLEADQEVVPLVFVESPEQPHSATAWLLRRDRVFLPAAAEAQSKTLALPHATAEQKFRAIANWARQHIEPGKEASSLDDVWELRSGNTAQMTALTLGMCQAAGLNVRSAYVNGSYVPGHIWRTKNQEQEWEPGHFSAYGTAGHMLVLEPPEGHDVWLQFSGQPAKFFSLDDLSDWQSGSLALVTGGDGVRIKRVRGEQVARPTGVHVSGIPVRHRVKVALDEKGNGKVCGEIQAYGFVGGQIRNLLSDPRRTQQVRDFFVQAFWPKVENARVTCKNELAPDRPLGLSYEGTVNELADPVERAYFLQPFRHPAFLTQFMGPAGREHDVVLKQELAELDVVMQYEAPPGHAWVEVPDDVFVCSEFGFYLADFNVEGRQLTCTRSFLMPAQRVPPAKYPELMKFLGVAAETERQRVAFAKAAFGGLEIFARPILSIGYASNGETDDQPKADEKAADANPPKAVPVEAPK